MKTWNQKPKTNPGDKYGSLVAIEPVDYLEISGKKFKRWMFLCDCGNTKIILVQDVRNGNTKSCGCKKSEWRITHGMSKSGAYTSWKSMMYRCYKQNTAGYAYYGGRGIKVCEEWHTFENFYRDMGNRPKNLTLDRFPDGNGNYEHSNCRWATWAQQSSNRSSNVLVCVGNERITRVEASRRLGGKDGLVESRISMGWTEEDAISRPIRKSMARPETEITDELRSILKLFSSTKLFRSEREETMNFCANLRFA